MDPVSETLRTSNTPQTMDSAQHDIRIMKQPLSQSFRALVLSISVCCTPWHGVVAMEFLAEQECYHVKILLLLILMLLLLVVVVAAAAAAVVVVIVIVLLLVVVVQAAVVVMAIVFIFLNK
jgi:hypothetical protein